MAHRYAAFADAITREFYDLLDGGDAPGVSPAARDRVTARRRRQIDDHLLGHERDWRFFPGDGGDPAMVSAFALRRELFLERCARTRVGEAADPARLALEMRRIKYFPMLLISAPHIEAGVTGTFPGIPTPLLYASAVLDRHLRIDEFPCFRTPEIMAVLNPACFDVAFQEQLDACLLRWRPHVVGISNLSEGHHFALRIARRAKALLPDTIVIMGGAHEDGTNPVIYQRASSRATSGARSPGRGIPRASADAYALSDEDLARLVPLQTLATASDREAVDFVAAGDCPYLFLELMTIVADNLRAPADDLKKIVRSQRDRFAQLEGSGYLFFHDPDSRAIEHVTLSGQSLNRNRLPFIFLGHLTHENRFPVFNGKKTAQVMACVGCKYSCAFCFESADQVLYEIPKLQPRDPEHVIKELDLRQEERYHAVFFDDSTFTQNPPAVCRLLELMIERRRRDGAFLEWGCQTTINDVTPALLTTMADAGCTYVYFGLESADPASDRVHKVQQLRAITTDRLWSTRFRRVAEWCHHVGIRVGTSLQFGLDDSSEQQEQTIDLVADLYRAGYIAKHSVALNINTPYPGTEEWLALAKRRGYTLPDYREPLRRHPGFETAHQFAMLSREAADRLYARAVEKLGDAIVGVPAPPPARRGAWPSFSAAR